MTVKKIGIFSAVFVSLIFVSCATTQKSVQQEGGSESVSIAVPKKKNTGYFFSIDKEILSLAENGSPASIRSLFSKLHKPLKEKYTDHEIVLLNICAELMSKVWKSESFSSDIPEADFYNPYLPIINSVDFGIYDTSSGDSDFFTAFLPNLLMLSGHMKNEYNEPMLASLKKCLEYVPDSMITNYFMGMLYIRMGNPSTALECLDKCSKNRMLEPIEVSKARQSAYFASGDYEKTISTAQRILKSSVNDKTSIEYLCRSLVKLGNWDEADKYSVKLLQMDPENIDYVLIRGRILVAREEYLKASSLLDSCEKLGANHRDYLLLRGWLQKNWSKNTSAVTETVTKALSLYPDELEILLLAAQVASAAENKIGNRTALELLSPVLEKEPGNLEVQELYITEMLRAGKYEESYKACKKLMEKGNAGITVLCAYAESCTGLGLKDEAWECAEKLYAENPKSEKVLQTYVKTMVTSVEKKDVINFINELIKVSSSSMKSFLYYEKSLVESSSDAMLEDLRTSLSFNARNVDALYRMYQVYYSSKNYKMAQFYLKQVVAIRPSDTDIQARLTELDSLSGSR